MVGRDLIITQTINPDKLKMLWRSLGVAETECNKIFNNSLKKSLILHDRKNGLELVYIEIFIIELNTTAIMI